MPQTERLLIAVVAVLVVAALVALIKLDIGRNGRPDAPGQRHRSGTTRLLNRQ